MSRKVKRWYKKPNVDWPVHERDPETGRIKFLKEKLNVSPNTESRRARRIQRRIRQLQAMELMRQNLSVAGGTP